MKYLNSKTNLKINKDYYQVEKIITRKTVGKNRMYLIKWEGYPLKDCSWEPVSHLDNISDMLENFNENYPNSIDKKRLKKYLRIIKRKENHIIRFKNPFLKEGHFKKINKKPKNNIMIYIDNSEFIERTKEKKEEQKDLETEEINNSIEIKKDEEIANVIVNENINELNETASEEKKSFKLIKPILIW